MTRYLLDVNVLIALIDPDHESHERAHTWFAAGGGADWVSSPATQNGVLRIVTNPRYANTQPMGLVLESLVSLVTSPGHTFVPDSESLLAPLVERERLQSSSEVTDSALLALAVAHRAKLATLDRRLVTTAVRGGAEALHVIGRGR